MRLEELERELRAERPEPELDFARRLDEWAEAGFPRDRGLGPGNAARAGALRRIWDRISSTPPRRMLVPAGAVATAVVIAGVVVSNVDRIGSGSGDSASTSSSSAGSDAGGAAAARGRGSRTRALPPRRRPGRRRSTASSFQGRVRSRPRRRPRTSTPAPPGAERSPAAPRTGSSTRPRA